MAGAPDPKPTSTRIKASRGQWSEIGAIMGRHPFCWGCGRRLTFSFSGSRHHLVPKRKPYLGDDVVSNLALLCGDGTTGCHGIYEKKSGTKMWRKIAAAIRDKMRDEHVRYITSKMGQEWLDANYPPIA